MRAHYLSIAECHRVRGTAVVIDVLRAFSTVAWAFHLGVERIVLTDDIEEALRIKARLPGALAMKDSQPLAGFELSNSPVELQLAEGLAGATIVQRTTHGTVGAWAARAAEQLYCASFLVAEATAHAIRDAGASEVYFVVTGEEGTAEEDMACAEYIAALIKSPGVEPEPYLRRARESSTAALLTRRIADNTPGVHALDIETCLRTDVFDFVMRAEVEPFGDTGLLTLRAYNRRNG
jgi:2-phosphosulfolactate phosphatase